MKVEIKPVKPVPVTVTLEMTGSEAKELLYQLDLIPRHIPHVGDGIFLKGALFDLYNALSKVNLW